MIKHLFKLSLLAALSFCSISSYAQPTNEPFIIEPQGTFPTEVLPDQVVFATYKISNNGTVPRHNNFVKYFPNDSVTQVLEPEFCGQNFTLQPKGRPNSSCLLRVRISGLVSGPTQPLVVCYKEGATCSQSNALNIALPFCPNPPNALVAVGGFNNETRAGYARSLNGGIDWISQLLPLEDKAESGLKSISCPCNACVAVGGGESNIGDLFPFVAITPDAGNTWPSQNLLTNLPNGFAAGFLNGVSCVGKNCTAVGSYTDPTTSRSQLGIANSFDLGQTWTQLALPAEFSPQFDTGILNGVTCISSNYCVGVGSYSIDDSEFDFYNEPVAVMSSDKINWAQTKIDLPVIPGFIVNGDLFGVECRNETCLAVGVLYLTEEEPNKFDSSIIKVPVRPGSKKFKSVSLKSLKTANAQGAKKLSSKSKPKSSALITVPIVAAAISEDNGVTWSELEITLPEGQEDPILGQLNGISCKTDVCIATGFERIESGAQQISIIFRESGITKTAITDPLNLVGFGIFCSSKVCATASGQFITPEPPILQPFAARSTDDGINWLVRPIYTTGAENGNLFGISGTPGA